jgi:hypothetical protein
MYVGGEFFSSLIVEISGSFTWLGGSLVFNVVKEVFRSVKNEVCKKFRKKEKEMKKRLKSKIENLVLGMFVVATVFGK